MSYDSLFKQRIAEKMKDPEFKAGYDEAKDELIELAAQSMNMDSNSPAFCKWWAEHFPQGEGRNERA